MSSDSATALRGSLVLGRYRIGEQIGQGGMGSVYQATDEVLNREVAVKVLKQELAEDQETLERFRREAKIAASLSHSGIARVLDFSEEGGSPFLVLELLRGKDLARVLVEEGRLEPFRAAEIARRVAEALQHAHDLGAVHRDVKPGNIFLMESGDVKVTDFGIATAAEQAPLTKTGDILGTAFYLAPEQVRGMPATPLSDVYALGCVLFEMVTGRPPFSAETSVATALARLDNDPPKASDFEPGVPPELEAVIQRALAPAAADRFGSAAAMADALARTAGSPTAHITQAIGPPTEVLTPPPGINPAIKTSVEKAKTALGPQKRPWAAVAAMALGLILLVILARACAPENAPRAVSLPSVVSLPFDQAKATLERQGLSVERGPDELSEQPAGHVFRQNPPPEASVLPGGRVTLWVSSGKGLKVPSLVGLTIEQAAVELKNAGLTGVVSSTVPGPRGGIITAQDPPAGTLIEPGTRVRLSVTQPEGQQGREGRDGEDGGRNGEGREGQRGKGKDAKID